MKARATDVYMVVVFLAGPNNNIYRQLKNELSNYFSMGRYEYPKDITSNYYLDINCKADYMPVVVSLNDVV